MNDRQSVHHKFLELTGFEGEEIHRYFDDWRLAAEKLGLTDDDVRFAVDEWIPKNWNISLRGVRKAIGAFIREAIDLTKAGQYKKSGVKIIYGILPALLTNYQAIKISGGDKVFVSFPDIFLIRILNSFFHKLNPYLETAEQEGGILYGCRHCALNKTRLAARMKDVIPAPDVIWTWGFNCDEGPKTDEYIQCYYDSEWRVEISRIPHDTHFGEIDDEIKERVEYLALEMKDSCEKVQEITGIQISQKHLAEAVNLRNRIALKLGELQKMVFSSDPLVLSGTAVAFISSVLSIPFNTGFEYVEEAIDILTREIGERIAGGQGILPKGAPNVGCYFVPSYLPWIDTLFRENGVGLTFSTITALSNKQLKPSSYDDPYMNAAQQWLMMPIGMNMGYEVEVICEKVEKFKPDAMLMGFFDFDRWVGAHHKMIAKLVEERTHVPHFYLEGDFWEDRDYSPEALRTRIESVSQVIKMRKEKVLAGISMGG